MCSDHFVCLVILWEVSRQRHGSLSYITLAFKGPPYYWVPCFGHNLHLTVNKVEGLGLSMSFQA